MVFCVEGLYLLLAKVIKGVDVAYGLIGCLGCVLVRVIDV